MDRKRKSSTWDKGNSFLYCRRSAGYRLPALAWLGLAWLGLAWLGLAWLGLAWFGLGRLGWAWLG
ncbi:hypothetical protein EYZ49_17250 [Salmonella enterica subsp. salamae serovar 13,22:z:-]|nr:hypothetical protein EYZ49_17250 [Salmonella enterica subsp. salamae serovar 13,22:z:-]